MAKRRVASGVIHGKNDNAARAAARGKGDPPCDPVAVLRREVCDLLHDLDDKQLRAVHAVVAVMARR